MHLLRSGVCLAAAGLVASGTLAFADDAPKTTATSKTLYLAQEGCGASAQPGRLEAKPQDDTDADGCGTIGGLPLNEVFHADEADFGPIADDYTSTGGLAPFIVDGSKPVRGQVAGQSWVGLGGIGTVTWDVHLQGTTTTGAVVDFGSATVSAPASPSENEVVAPFQLSVPAAAAGKTFKKFVISVAQRGQNVGMSSKRLQGESYVVIPAKVPPKKPVKKPVRRR
jgi:hypothetical protein